MFAFGLCVLELATTKKLDHTAQQNWAEVVEMVQDKETKTFIERCVKPCAQCLSETIYLLQNNFIRLCPGSQLFTNQALILQSHDVSEGQTRTNGFPW